MDIAKSNKTALVFGGTGLVGGHLLRLLCHSSHYSKVIHYGRRPVELKDPKLSNEIIDFSRLLDVLKNLSGDDCYICLGTTIKKAGSKDNFRKIDRDYVLEIAEMASKNVVNQLLLVSSVGADANSGILYNRVKGQTEAGVRKMKFWAIHIFRPSILLGDRKESRPLERAAVILGSGLNKISSTFLGKYQPVPAEKVAKKMIQAASGLNPGIHYHNSAEINSQSAPDSDSAISFE